MPFPDYVVMYSREQRALAAPNCALRLELVTSVAHFLTFTQRRWLDVDDRPPRRDWVIAWSGWLRFRAETVQTQPLTQATVPTPQKNGPEVGVTATRHPRPSSRSSRRFGS